MKKRRCTNAKHPHADHAILRLRTGSAAFWHSRLAQWNVVCISQAASSVVGGL
ncbi:MAG: hypothetical protein ABIL11_10320 [Chloroflexota bacterium]